MIYDLRFTYSSVILIMYVSRRIHQGIRWMIVSFNFWVISDVELFKIRRKFISISYERISAVIERRCGVRWVEGNGRLMIFRNISGENIKKIRVCPSIYPSIHLFIYPSIYLRIYFVGLQKFSRLVTYRIIPIYPGCIFIVK